MSAGHPLMRWFAFDHLPPDLQEVSCEFRSVAETVLGKTEPGAEQTTALRKLIEAKDAAVRAALEKRERDLG